MLTDLNLRLQTGPTRQRHLASEHFSQLAPRRVFRFGLRVAETEWMLGDDVAYWDQFRQFSLQFRDFNDLADRLSPNS